MDHSSLDAYTPAAWPAIHPEAEEAKKGIASTHRVVPLPAYDTKGNLIEPRRYRDALPGAMVRVNFTLSHWHFPALDPHHTFVADIVSVRILVDPAPQSAPKRKTAKRDPEIGASPRRMKAGGQDGSSKRA